jgi:predicted Zn-dependent protease
MRAASPAFSLEPEWLNVYGNQLMKAGRAKEAVPVLRLGTKMAPDWSWIADSLAEAYEAVGERQLAIAEYRRALTIEPTLGHSIERLKALGVEATVTAKAAGS